MISFAVQFFVFYIGSLVCVSTVFSSPPSSTFRSSTDRVLFLYVAMLLRVSVNFRVAVKKRHAEYLLTATNYDYRVKIFHGEKIMVAVGNHSLTSKQGLKNSCDEDYNGNFSKRRGNWTLRQSTTFDGGKTVSDAGATTVSVGSRFGEQDLPHFFEAKKWGSSQRPFS